MASSRPIKIAITAMGGQGGGVLSSWIVGLAEKCGYVAQYTSVPGVAQRTGATVYYLEIFPMEDIERHGKAPVLALMPVAGDVDIVLASELMEAGRALARGFVTSDTTLIASSHRVYAIGEKIQMGDGRSDPQPVLDLAAKTTDKFICFDMEAAANAAGSVISSVLFGALAGSGALPFAREEYEQTIRDGGKAVEANLAGFAIGFDGVEVEVRASQSESNEPENEQGGRSAISPLMETLAATFPATTHYLLKEGLKKVVDYQDVSYGQQYLEQMARMRDLDASLGGERRQWRLTKDVGRHLALWMSYEDTIRVADLKTRKSRFTRVAEEIRAEAGQIFHVSEYFHPRIHEICDILPAPLGAAIMSGRLKDILGRYFQSGRRITTTKLPGFLLLKLIATLRVTRRSTYRYRIERERIDAWLGRIRQLANSNYALACEFAGLQRLIKGYGETHERGLANFQRITDSYTLFAHLDDADQIVARLKEAALADENGQRLEQELAGLSEQQRVA